MLEVIFVSKSPKKPENPKKIMSKISSIQLVVLDQKWPSAGLRDLGPTFHQKLPQATPEVTFFNTKITSRASLKTGGVGIATETRWFFPQAKQCISHKYAIFD